jgi:hypothetical protein
VGDGHDLLDEAGVLGAAMESAQLSDFGADETFRIGLRVFVDALEEMNPAPELRETARSYVNKLLTDRLRWVADETAHPEILEVPVDSPVIIVGFPRTGTTILYDLLACDPNVRAPLYWEAADCWPAPEVATFQTDPRIAKAEAEVAWILSEAPQVASMLPTGAQLPAECNRFMPYHFYGPEIGTFYGVPKHSKWVAQEPAPGLYKTHRRVLQQLAWKGPRGRWTLKSPVHLFNLGDLVDEYPDASLIWTHRDPILCLTSLTDLIGSIQTIMGHNVDRRELGAEIFDVFGAALERGLAARADPRVEARIMDIAFRETAADPVATVRRVHARFDLPFTAEHERRIGEFIAAHPKGTHPYDPGDYGYTAEQFHSRFAAYYERFGDLI